MLTAAHSVEDREIDGKAINYHILAGTNELDSEQGQTIKVNCSIIHEQYNGDSFFHDIAVLEIVEDVEEPVTETSETEQPTTTTNTSSSSKSSGGGSVGILILLGLVGLSVMRSRQRSTAK